MGRRRHGHQCGDGEASTLTEALITTGRARTSILVTSLMVTTQTLLGAVHTSLMISRRKATTSSASSCAGSAGGLSMARRRSAGFATLCAARTASSYLIRSADHCLEVPSIIFLCLVQGHLALSIFAYSALHYYPQSSFSFTQFACRSMV